MITTPELFAYKIDPLKWSKKMIAPGTRDMNWDLVIENMGSEIYTFPLFTEEFCSMVIEHAEKTGNWTKARHLVNKLLWISTKTMQIILSQLD